MATILCAAAPGDAGNTINVVAYGYGFQIPLAVCQSFSAFQSWLAQNTVVTAPGADQGGWTDLMAGAGVTMGA